MVKASRAWKYAQTQCMTFLTWVTSVSIDNTVSTSIRKFIPLYGMMRL